MDIDDLRTMHRTTLDLLDALVAELGPTDLSRPTPCAGWDVATLLAHEIGQHRGFAAAVRDGDAPVEAYRRRAFDTEAWRESVGVLTDSFRSADPGRRLVLREIASDPMPLRFTVVAQLLDTAVHGWDLARALGTDFRPPTAIIGIAAAAAAGIPDDARRRTPDAAFASAVSAGPAPDDWTGALAGLGRDPQWRP